MFLSHKLVLGIVDFERELVKIETIPQAKRKSYLKNQHYQELVNLAKMIDIDLNLEEARKILASGTTKMNGDFRDNLLSNLSQVLTMVDSMAMNHNILINADRFLEINKNIGKSVAEDWQLNYRKENDQFSLIYENFAVNVPKENRQIATGPRVEQLLEDINSVELAKAYRISLLMYNLLVLHPFISFNKLTIALIFRLMLTRIYGQDTIYLSGSKFLLEEERNIQQIIEAKDIAAGEVLWHELLFTAFSKILTQQNNSLKEQRADSTNGSKPFLDLNKRQLRILKYLQNIATVKREDYVEMMDVSPMTAYRDLNELLESNLIKTTGNGRGTKYMLSSR